MTPTGFAEVSKSFAASMAHILSTHGQQQMTCFTLRKVAPGTTALSPWTLFLFRLPVHFDRLRCADNPLSIDLGRMQIVGTRNMYTDSISFSTSPCVASSVWTRSSSGEVRINWYRFFFAVVYFSRVRNPPSQKRGEKGCTPAPGSETRLTKKSRISAGGPSNSCKEASRAFICSTGPWKTRGGRQMRCITSSSGFERLE